MLNPLSELLLLVGGLYFLECLRWVSPSSVGIRSLLAGRHAIARPRKIGSHWHRALLPAAPWPPFGSLFVTDELPIRLSPNGLVLPSARSEGWTLPAEGDESVTRGDLRIEGTELRRAGRVVAVFGTRRLAFRIRRLLRGSLDEAELQAFFEERFDVEEARRRLSAWRQLSAPLIVACNLLFAALVTTLVVLVSTPFGVRLFACLGLLVGSWLVAGVLFEWTLRRALPRPLRPPVGRRVVTILSPLSLMRAHDEIRCELLGDFDPLTVASVLLRPSEFRAFARETLAALTYPLHPEHASSDPHVNEVNSWHRAQQEVAVRRLLAENGIEPATLLGAPLLEGAARAWCPRCRATFMTPTGTCSSCRGVALCPAEA